MLPAGSQLTIVVTGSAESFWTSWDFWNGVNTNQLNSEVSARLLGSVEVHSITISDRGMTDVGAWQYRAVVQCSTLVDHNKPADVAAIVNHAFYEVTGYMPTAAVTSHGDPAPPELPAGPSIPGADTVGSIGDRIAELIENIGTAGVVAAVVVIGVIVLVELRR